MSQSRRDFFKAGAAALGSTALSSLIQQISLAETGAPHFLLVVCYAGGLDPTYLFDARSLRHTDLGLQQNYLYKNTNPGGDALNQPLGEPAPLLYTGRNGTSTLRSPITNDLMRHKDDLCILNGCMMSAGDNGHGQNMYYMFGGKSALGDSFLPTIGKLRNTPLESVHLGSFAGDGNQRPTNFANSAVFSPASAGAMASMLAGRPSLDVSTPEMKFISSRFAKNGVGSGMFSLGSAKAAEGFARAPRLYETLKNLKFSGRAGVRPGQLGDAMTFVRDIFTGGITNCFTVMMNTDGDPDFQLDVHAASSAQQMPRIYRTIVGDIGFLIDYLKATPFNETQSMFDVTTLAIVSEFARTSRQAGVSIDNTGTDHNQLNNTVILAGKGIRGGMVVGESDLRELTEDGRFANISEAHKKFDPTGNMIMAKPFDFERMCARDDLPTQFDAADYITFSCVTNTLYKLFKVPESHYLRLPNGRNASTLGILS